MSLHEIFCVCACVHEILCVCVHIVCVRATNAMHVYYVSCNRPCEDTYAVGRWKAGTLDRQTEKQTDRETDRLTARQADRQTGRQTDRH